jgi:uncharacterized protein with GYD domain
MPIYVSLIQFRENGWSTMKEEGIARSQAVQAHIESLGGVLLDAYYCLGKYDVVAILDFPDHRSAIKASVRNSSLGHMRITTMPALSRTAWRDLLREIWGAPTANNWWRGSHQKPSSPEKY